MEMSNRAERVTIIGIPGIGPTSEPFSNHAIWEIAEATGGTVFPVAGRAAVLRAIAAAGESRLIMYGYSRGALDALSVASRLHRRQLPVELLVTIDPVVLRPGGRPLPVPSNVRRTFNFYQTNRILSGIFRGCCFRGTRLTGTNVTNHLLGDETHPAIIRAAKERVIELISRAMQ